VAGPDHPDGHLNHGALVSQRANIEVQHRRRSARVRSSLRSLYMYGLEVKLPSRAHVEQLVSFDRERRRRGYYADQPGRQGHFLCDMLRE
jgi:hypothetical protein